jgi:hypothetical protein
MARIYRLVHDGVLPLEDATRLIYMLGKIVSTIKAARELDGIDGELARTPFRGIVLVPPTGVGEIASNRSLEAEETPSGSDHRRIVRAPSEA